MNIGKKLAKDAKTKGICNDWHDQLRTLGDNKKAMLAMYVKGIDFCLSNDFPDNKFIREHFVGVMEDYGVFIDDDIRLTNYKRCVALGSTKARVEVESYNVCEVFAKHDSEINIIAKGDSFIEVDVFDSSVVHIYAQDRAKVHINRYGGTVVIAPIESKDAIVKVNEKNKKTY